MNFYKTFTFILIFGNFDNGLKSVLNTFEKLKQVANYDFGKLYKQYDISLKGFSSKEIDSLQQYISLLNRGNITTQEYNETLGDARSEVLLAADGFKNLKIAVDTGAISEKQYTQATQNLALTQKTATTTTKVLSVALNALSNIAMSLVLNALFRGIVELGDRLVTTSEELDQLRTTTGASLENLKTSTQSLTDEIQDISNLTAEYKSVVESVGDTSEAKDSLLKIQDDLIKKFGDEAKGLDLVNDKYDDNIKKIQKYSAEKQKEWEREHADEILMARQLAEINITPTSHDITGAVDLFKNTTANAKGYKSSLEDTVKSLFVIKNVNKDLQEYINNLDGVDYYLKGIFKDDVLLTGSIYDARDALGALIDSYKKYENADSETLGKLRTRYDEIKSRIEAMESLNEVSSNNLFNNIFETAIDGFERVTNVASVSGDTMRAKWLENLDEMQKGSLKNISTMVSALQDLSEGKGIAANTFWQLVEFDTEGLLNGAKLVGDRFVITQENMIKLKDQYIKKQIEELQNTQIGVKLEKEKYEQEVKRYEMEIARLTLQKKSITSNEFQSALSNLEKAKAGAKAFGDEWERNNWLIQYLNQTLGNTIDLQKQLEAQQKQLNKELTALNKELDNYQKAYEAKIDGIIKGLETELNTLESEKEVLEDELDVLEKREDVLKETLDNYEKVNSYVQKIIDKEIEGLEEQRDAIKNTYDERINKLKEENEEREDALDYAQKLANLENAQNNRRRVYDEERGWHYATVKEDVVKAESDLRAFETNQEVKKLEKERDAEIKAWDNLIQKKKDYKDQWASWLEEIQDEEAEALLVQEAGADARQRIANGDLSLIETFSTQYRKHNSDLQILTNTEIKLKKAEIDAKNEDIKASKERIQAWKDYKTQFSTAVNDIKNANQEYMNQIGTIQLNEASSLEERERAFETFKNAVTGYIDQIGAKQSEIDKVTAALDEIQSASYSIDFEVNNLDELRSAKSIMEEMAAAAAAVATGVAALSNQDLAKKWISDENFSSANYVQELLRRRGYSDGGVANYTGIAMLHGSPNNPETIFNAKDSAKLYDMVHNTPNLMADMLNQATKLSGFKLSSNENSNNSSVLIGAINVYANNPNELTQGLDKTLDRYFRTKLTQSYTNKQ